MYMDQLPYRNVSLIKGEDKNLILAEYNDLLQHPVELISALGNVVEMELSKDKNEPFTKTKKSIEEFDLELKRKSLLLYQELLKQKIYVNS